MIYLKIQVGKLNIEAEKEFNAGYKNVHLISFWTEIFALSDKVEKAEILFNKLRVNILRYLLKN